MEGGAARGSRCRSSRCVWHARASVAAKRGRAVAEGRTRRSGQRLECVQGLRRVKNAGQFATCVGKLANDAKKVGLISSAQGDAISACASPQAGTHYTPSRYRRQSARLVCGGFVHGQVREPIGFLVQLAPDVLERDVADALRPAARASG